MPKLFGDLRLRDHFHEPVTPRSSAWRLRGGIDLHAQLVRVRVLVSEARDRGIEQRPGPRFRLADLKTLHRPFALAIGANIADEERLHPRRRLGRGPVGRFQIRARYAGIGRRRWWWDCGERGIRRGLGRSSACEQHDRNRTNDAGGRPTRWDPSCIMQDSPHLPQPTSRTPARSNRGHGEWSDP